MRRMLLSLPLLALATSGCYRMDLDATALEPHIHMTGRTTETAQPEVVGSFEGRITGSWLLWGLAPLREPDVAEVLRREIGRYSGSAATGVEVVTQQRFIDGLLMLITLGVYGQRTTIVRGNVVR